jgi:hypothetical protein
VLVCPPDVAEELVKTMVELVGTGKAVRARE